MSAHHDLQNPTSFEALLLFRLTRLVAVAGAPVVRLCEGRHGITRREWRIIAALALQGPMLSSALAEHVHLDRGRTSKTVSDLAAKQLVTRTPRPHDRRQVEVQLTDAAQAIYAALFPAVVRINQDLLACLSAAEVASLDTILTRLQQRAGELLAGNDLPKADRRRGRSARAPTSASQ